MSWLGTSDREGRDPPPDDAGRVAWALIPLLALVDAVRAGELAAGRLTASRLACVLIPCVMPMTGRITAAADWREAGSYESRRAATSHNPQLAETIPDHAQAAAHLRRSGRGLVSYHRIPADAPALADLFNSPQDTR